MKRLKNKGKVIRAKGRRGRAAEPTKAEVEQRVQRNNLTRPPAKP